jgi:hypothetical protein
MYGGEDITVKGKVRAMAAIRRTSVSVQSFLTSALDGNERLTSCPGCFTVFYNTCYPLWSRLGGPTAWLYISNRIKIYFPYWDRNLEGRRFRFQEWVTTDFQVKKKLSRYRPGQALGVPGG